MALSGACKESLKELKKILSVDNLSRHDIEQMNKDYLNLIENLKNRDLTIITATKLYAFEDFVRLKKDFRNLLQEFYKCEIEQLSTLSAEAAAFKINGWLSNKTNEKMKEINSLNINVETSSLLLVNVFYFKGKFLYKYSLERKRFNFSKISKKAIVMMNLHKRKFKMHFKPLGLNATTCQLHFKGAVAMTIILPNENEKMRNIEENLSIDIISQILNEGVRHRANVSVPTFKLTKDIELSNYMKKMGADEVFHRKNADFRTMYDLVGTGFRDYAKMYMSSIAHRAMFEIDTETAQNKRHKPRTSRKTIYFNCNKPFLYLVHDTKEKRILFMGRYGK